MRKSSQLTSYSDANGVAPDLTTINISSMSNLFISGPIAWSYLGRRTTMEPTIPDLRGGTLRLPAYFASTKYPDDPVLLPIHDSCLTLLGRLCSIRQEQRTISQSCNLPMDLESFCHALARREQQNGADYKITLSNHYYGKSGGLEWEHDYYGARRFWAQNWDTEPGWEVRGNILRA